MTHSYAQDYFQQLAKKLTVYEPVFINQDTFVIQTPLLQKLRKETYQVNQKLSSLFEQHFPAYRFCCYKIIKYYSDSVNHGISCTQYKLAWRVNETDINIWYSFFPNQRMTRINGKTIVEATFPEKEDIVDFFLQTIEELPENRLLVATNAVPLMK